MTELERTFLVNKLPPDLKNCPSKEIHDIYIPKSSVHPVLRIRKNGNKYEITKKFPVIVGDASKQHEFTVPLDAQEFENLKALKGKEVRKIRYFYAFNNLSVEVDVFQDKLRGLVLADFEFETEKEKSNFKTPDFCLAEVTQATFLAGGMLCGKSYSDIQTQLEKFGYSKLV